MALLVKAVCILSLWRVYQSSSDLKCERRSPKMATFVMKAFIGTFFHAEWSEGSVAVPKIAR